MKELLLQNGDYVSDNTGGQVHLEAEEAMLQRVLFRLAARRGQFAPMPELGSLLYTLGRERGSKRLPAARQYVAQALQEEPVTVEDISFTDAGSGRIRLTVTASYNGQTLTAAVLL